MPPRTQIEFKGAPTVLKLAAPVPLTNHPAAVYLSSLKPGSRPTMHCALNAIARMLTDGECDAMSLDWAALRYQHTAAVRTALMENYAPAAANKMLCALRRVLKEALKLELLDATAYSYAADLPSIREEKKFWGRALSAAEIAAVMGACAADPTVKGRRDAALLAILRGSGIRRAELVNLELKDFDPSTKSLQINQGKGGRDRRVYLPTGAIPLVEQWLSVRGSAPGPLLYPVNKGGRVEIKKLHPDAVWRIVKRRASEAGVDSFSPHDFRRTFCSDLLSAGVDVLTVQKLAGHSSPVTTSRYDHRGEVAKSQAVERLEF